MAKNKQEFVCTACGAIQLQWAGQCSNCQAWNSLEAVGSAQFSSAVLGSLSKAKAIQLQQIKAQNYPRISSGFSELDKTLGGGFVAGSVILIGGDPGIGKSTLILQTLANINTNHLSFYISGEESESQIATRAKRLGISENLLLTNESNLEHILDLTKQIKPKIMVIDSIQTMFSNNNNSIAGSVSQVRDCAAQLTIYAKKTNTTLLMIGHMTKGGAIAGPRILEHMVDTVLYFEGDAGGRYRIVRAVKNRFGAVNEIGVFAMENKGLLQISNPSAIFLAKHQKPASGSVVMVTREASRPLLVELQALVNQNLGNNPSRVCVGIDHNRLVLLLAILQKHGGLGSYDKNVFINIVGGLKISETASDLALILAVVSSIYNKPLPKDLVVFGELGLTGEIRPVYNGLERLSEAKKHGFKQALIPKGNTAKNTLTGIKIITVMYLADALAYFGELP